MAIVYAAFVLAALPILSKGLAKCTSSLLINLVEATTSLLIVPNVPCLLQLTSTLFNWMLARQF